LLSKKPNEKSYFGEELTKGKTQLDSEAHFAEMIRKSRWEDADQHQCRKMMVAIAVKQT